MVMRMGKCSLASEVETDQSDSSAKSLEAQLMSGEVDRPFVGSRILVMNDVVGCINFFGLLFASFIFVCVRIKSGVMSINIPKNKRQYVVAEKVRDRRVVTSAATAMW